MNNFYLYILFLFLLLKFFLAVSIILYGGIGLGPDEAQYWTWSQKLNGGYYSKPPGIAWQIWLGTHLWGNTEFGVRFFSLIIGFLLPLSVYFLAKAADLKSSTAFWSALCLAFCPAGWLSSLLAITDGGYLLFWTIACAIVAKALTNREEPNYILLGVCIAFGALFKWPIYIFWVFAIPFGLFYTQKFDRTISYKKIFLGLFISLFGLLPSVFWNYSHEWATFRHVFYTIKGGASEPGTNMAIFKGNFLDFFGAQAALFSPLIFLFYLISPFIVWKEKQLISKSLLFCAVISYTIFLGGLLLSLFQKMQGNWTLQIIPSGFVFLTWVFCEKVSWGKKGLGIALVLSIIFFWLTFLITPIKNRVYKHNIGWENLDLLLLSNGYEPNKDFLFSDRYQTTSILSFYGPQKQRAYFLNLQGIRKNQFSFWPGMEQEQVGKNGYFIWIESGGKPNVQEEISRLQMQLEPYFDSVTFLGITPLVVEKNRTKKMAAIFKGISYNGKLPKETQKY